MIDTADVDVLTPRSLPHTGNNNQQQRNHRLRRDRPTIRIRTQALKDNPALREHYERHEKTVGELLVEKFLIKDKKPEGETDFRPKLYTQVSLESAVDRKEREELQEALQRRVTRRMTRRRSSADIQMDPEQLEREVLFAQAQADALDTLVAEEQAEIEVETRMGTLIRKNLVRTMPSVLGKHDNKSDDEEGESRTKKLAKKVKKRKKTTDKPSEPSGSELDSENDASRIKATDIEATNISINGNDIEKILVNDNDYAEDPPTSPSKALKFKIEASNSVGDFSTLWINASGAEAREKQIKNLQTIEQFRDSVRLPAPKQALAKIAKSDAIERIIEEHQQLVVLPVRKRYIKDDSRNSVYLTLKPQKNGIANKVGEEDVKSVENSSMSIINGNADNAKLTAMTNLKIATTQPGENKVAKFRSKDIIDSDIEIEKIFDLPRGAVRAGKTLTKVERLQNLSELGGEIDETEKKLISVSGDRREVEIDAPKILHVSKVAKKSSLVKDKNGFKGAENSCMVESAQEENSKVVSINGSTVKLNVHDNGADEAISDAAVVEEIGRDLSGEETKEGKNVRVQKSGERKKIERSVSALDSSDRKVAVHLERSKSDGQEKDPGVTRILSSDSLCSIPECLPNAPTINYPKVDAVVKTRGRETNELFHDNLKTILNVNLNKDSLGSTKNSENSAEVENNIFKSVVEAKVDGLADLRKVEKKSSDVLSETKIIESPDSATPKQKDKNIFKFEDDNKLSESSKNFSSSIDAIDQNVADVSKLRNNRKISPNISSLDSTERNKTPPESPDVKDGPKNRPTSDGPKKIAVKKNIISSINGEKGPSALIEKAESSSEKKNSLISKDSQKTEIELSKTINEPKLTNGIRKVKPKIIEETKERVSKIEKTLKTTKVHEDESIDFWREIESQQIIVPMIKVKIEPDDMKENNVPDSIPIVEKDNIVNSATSLHQHVKFNMSTETSATPVTKTDENIVGDEKKSNKMKKKKTTDSTAEKKKDQKKASTNTISERMISGDEGDGTEQQQQLSGEGFESENNEEKSFESLVAERFERNLSTIAEEALSSPVTEKLPEVIQDKKQVPSPLSQTEESLKSLLSLVGIVAIGTSDLNQPEVTTVPEVQESKLYVAKNIETELQSLTKYPLISELSLPKINVEEPPKTPPAQEEKNLLGTQPVFLEFEELPEEKKNPGTPTNEIAEEILLNISKWNGRADLSLDEPDKDIGPEATIETKEVKTNSSKKKGSSKTGSKKKGSSKKESVKSNSPGTTPGTSPDSSKKKKLGKRKKSLSKVGKDIEKKTIFEERSSNSSDSTLKPSGLNLRNSPKNSPRNSPKQRPLDLIKMFYTTPASLLTATPRDLSKVRRAKIKKKKHSTRTASASSDSTGSTRSTQSTGTGGSTEHEDDAEQKRISSTRSNDSGFDGSPRLSSTDLFDCCILYLNTHTVIYI